jgi:hypothetical protein
MRGQTTPSPDLGLTEWPPTSFVVLVNTENPDHPNDPPSYRVFVDGMLLPGQHPATPPDQAGMSTISFFIRSQDPIVLDDKVCHHVLLTVARQFNPMNVPDQYGGDSVLWTYYGPSAPYGCVTPLLDGQAPPSDAADGPFIPPSEGGGQDP